MQMSEKFLLSDPSPISLPPCPASDPNRFSSKALPSVNIRRLVIVLWHYSTNKFPLQPLKTTKNRRVFTAVLSFAIGEKGWLVFAFHFRKALAAVYRSVLSGFERNLCLFAASSANSGEHFSFRSRIVFACVTASFASLRLVYEAFFSVELLLAGSEYEFRATLFANKGFVLVHFFYLA